MIRPVTVGPGHSIVDVSWVCSSGILATHKNRNFVFPNYFLGGVHLENGLGGAFADEGVTIGEPVGVADVVAVK